MPFITKTISDFSASPSSISIMAMGIICRSCAWRVPTTPTTLWLSSGNIALASFTKMQIHLASPHSSLTPAGGRFLARAQKGYLQWRMGGNFNTSTEVENQGEGPANSPSDDPLPLEHGQRAIGNLSLRWLLGNLPLGIESRSIRHQFSLQYWWLNLFLFIN